MLSIFGGGKLRKLKKYVPTKFKAKDSVYDKEAADFVGDKLDALETYICELLTNIILNALGFFITFIVAAVGMAVLFCAATKCPFATILLCCEMFGFACAPLIIPAVITSFIAARYQGLYSNSKDIIKCIMHHQ